MPLAQSAPVSTPQPPRQVRLRCIRGRAALTSAAFVEECDECRLRCPDSRACTGGLILRSDSDALQAGAEK